MIGRSDNATEKTANTPKTRKCWNHVVFQPLHPSSLLSPLWTLKVSISDFVFLFFLPWHLIQLAATTLFQDKMVLGNCTRPRFQGNWQAAKEFDSNVFFPFSCRGRGASAEHLELKETEYVSDFSFFLSSLMLINCLRTWSLPVSKKWRNSFTEVSEPIILHLLSRKRITSSESSSPGEFAAHLEKQRSLRSKSFSVGCRDECRNKGQRHQNNCHVSESHLLPQQINNHWISHS